MSSTIRLCLVFAVLLLGGCAQGVPPLNFSVPNVGPSSTKLEAELRSMTVTVARPDERTGDLPPDAAAVTPLWQNALQEALNRMVIFRDDNPRKVSLSVKVLKLDFPLAGIDFTTQAAARYEIIDRNNGDIILSQVVESSGTAPANFAFLGVARLRESVNRSVQNNIARFLQILGTADLARPQFPAAGSGPGRTPTSGNPPPVPPPSS